MYNQFNEDGNNIGDAGVMHLFKATWTKLTELTVSFVREKGDLMRLWG
jgi:hypothetical protein